MIAQFLEKNNKNKQNKTKKNITITGMYRYVIGRFVKFLEQQQNNLLRIM